MYVINLIYVMYMMIKEKVYLYAPKKTTARTYHYLYFDAEFRKITETNKEF